MQIIQKIEEYKYTNKYQILQYNKKQNTNTKNTIIQKQYTKYRNIYNKYKKYRIYKNNTENTNRIQRILKNTPPQKRTKKQIIQQYKKTAKKQK